MKQINKLVGVLQYGESLQSSNGGEYRHEVVYKIQHGGHKLISGKNTWVKYYTTTSEFPFCQNCGRYTESCDCIETPEIEATEDYIIQSLKAMGAIDVFAEYIETTVELVNDLTLV